MTAARWTASTRPTGAQRWGTTVRPTFPSTTGALYEHASVLKFIEAVFGLPTLASINHRFDASTPGGPGNEASAGRPSGPPAPPRDGLSSIGSLMECFTF